MQTSVCILGEDHRRYVWLKWWLVYVKAMHVRESHEQIVCNVNNGVMEQVLEFKNYVLSFSMKIESGLKFEKSGKYDC